MRPPRHGVIERVVRADPSPRYEIRWDDGSLTIFSPALGGLTLAPEQSRPAAPDRKAAAAE